MDSNLRYAISQIFCTQWWTDNNLYKTVSNNTYIVLACKVQLFWEGHKNLHHPPYGFDIYLVNGIIIRMIVQIFVAFSEKLNFI